MLHVYKAELNDSELTWEQKPPKPLKHQRVLVIVEDMTDAAENHIESFEQPKTYQPRSYQLVDLAGQLTWQGDALDEQRAQRDAW